MGSGWRFEVHGGRLAYHLHGDFDLVDARALEADMRERLDAGSRHCTEVVFMFNELSRMSVDARSVLAGLQGWLAVQVRRTVYVSNRPLFRGVALWIIHTAPDSGARVFPSEGLAEDWLRESTRRLDFVRGRALASVARLQARWAGRRRA